MHSYSSSEVGGRGGCKICLSVVPVVRNVSSKFFLYSNYFIENQILTRLVHTRGHVATILGFPRVTCLFLRIGFPEGKYLSSHVTHEIRVD